MTKQPMESNLRKGGRHMIPKAIAVVAVVAVAGIAAVVVKKNKK